MTKHNGKARNVGLKVGQALIKRNKQGNEDGSGKQFKHTTDFVAPSYNAQSVLHTNDLSELLALADLADRDFTAERSQVVVISTGAKAVGGRADGKSLQQLQDEHADVLCIPRRPAWDASTSAEELDSQERAAFLNWRRQLAALENEEGITMTPFEKNLEVWRQLWRVIERSDIIVQVVDARDPLFYYSTDLEQAAREVNEHKASFVLLNKADLLPPHVRRLWADHFDARHLPYAFWSAYLCAPQQASKPNLPAREPECPTDDERIKILDCDSLLAVLESHAKSAVEAGAKAGEAQASTSGRPVTVGLVGYPNVGKSSTINALFGSKKTAVAPTPGKTKHFQTLFVSETLCLCDCPGLVLPRLARSKEDMIAAGVVVIDHLTDVRAPVELVALRAGVEQLKHVYGLTYPAEPGSQVLTGASVLRAMAMARGWTANSGLPDETRAGRQLLKDYVAGKLLFCRLPPTASADGSCRQHAAAWRPSFEQAPGGQRAEVSPAGDAVGPEADEPASTEKGEGGAQLEEAAATGVSRYEMTEADLDMLNDLQGPIKKQQQKRPEYKFQKKPSRVKARAGAQQAAGKHGLADGDALPLGQRGGLVRVPS